MLHLGSGSWQGGSEVVGFGGEVEWWAWGVSNGLLFFLVAKSFSSKS